MQILIMPGVLTSTDFAKPASIKAGGPLGELVQWSDLIAAVFVLGHKVILEWDTNEANKWLANMCVTDNVKP